MANESEHKRILIVDDQDLIQQGLIRVINRERDFDFCGSAHDIASARKAIALQNPDLVIMDILLPDGCGLALIEDLVPQYPSLAILVVSQCDEALYAERALKAGARGFVMKSRAASEIPKAMRAILNGEYYVSPQVAALALHRMAIRKGNGRQDTVGKLTNRELQVFQLLGTGMKTKGIAAKLRLSVKTVQTHRESIKHKLQLSSAPELTHYATNWVTSQGSVHRSFPDEENPSQSPASE
ncbi:MAG TPA: response regulator transcription factor [Candidatus Sulfotelmatobacter sp.]|nr:response regulator transcription factor [Candidatus Sulfotelmatobacter sp.]